MTSRSIVRPRPRTLSQIDAASYIGIGVKTLREIIRAGQGPRAFNPLHKNPRYATAVLDEWIAGRDDFQPLLPDPDPEAEVA